MGRNFDFIGRKRIWFALSGAIIIAGLIAAGVRGLNFGVEFTGGTLVTVKFAQKVEVEDLRKVLKDYKLGESIIQPLEKGAMLIRYSQSFKETAKNRELQKRLIAALDEKFGIKDKTIQEVGPGWGEEIRNTAIIALIVALGALLLYISLRFEFKMATSAIVALFHDLLITVGVYALVGRMVTPATVAAILTILGYSLYDTIVVFHRIMENTKKMSKQSYGSMVNGSINQVLARSINTSFTTILPVIAILFIGGETLKDFAFALFVGLLSGAYSSIFTASPLLVLWKEIEPRYKNLKKKYGYAPVRQ